MPKSFHGRCPICATQLLFDDHDPETVVCPKKHYACRADDFNKLWKKFETQVQQLGVDQASAAHAQQLLKDLRALNTVKEAQYGT